ncbi:MAG: type transport system ATP-binding protein, partial [Thermoleophilaceae bacterium]|nr:type transport system ATP-binding protein [Thermoleophilaceae bacterium]
MPVRIGEIPDLGQLGFGRGPDQVKSLRGLGGVVVLLLLLPVSASASPAPLGLTKCSAAGQGLRQCSGLVPTWDGVPLDTTVTLPRGGGRKLPLVVLIHGFGNSKYEYLQKGDSAYTGNAYDFAEHGYAVLTYTARGLWGSCGTPEARLANVLACAAGYIRLADIRYEVRDTQELVGRLVDEGVARADAIGVTGDSYGGGQSLDLAALRNRVMLTNGRLAPWRSPDGAKLTITASAPVIPWSDLASAATPNGRTSIDDVMPRSSPGDPIGVAKASFVTAIAAATQIATGPGQPPNEPFVIGRPSGFVALPGRDPQTDILGWVARIQEGEPYDNASARGVYDSIQHYHSAYQVDSSRPP